MDIEAMARVVYDNLPGRNRGGRIEIITAFGLACYRAGVGDAEGVAREHPKHSLEKGCPCAFDIAQAIHRLGEQGGGGEK